MDFDQLHTFLEIVRLKSFSKAAQTCFRTQPAISAQIRQMEQELGTQLFERFGSRISLTVAGKTFAGHARQLLDLKREAFDEVRELDRIPKGEVSIAANEATCINVLPKVFSTYAERFPKVQLQVIRSYSTRTIQSVLDNSVDFGLHNCLSKKGASKWYKFTPMKFASWFPLLTRWRRRNRLSRKRSPSILCCCPKGAEPEAESTSIWTSSKTGSRSRWRWSPAR